MSEGGLLSMQAEQRRAEVLTIAYGPCVFLDLPQHQPSGPRHVCETTCAVQPSHDVADAELVHAFLRSIQGLLSSDAARLFAAAPHCCCSCLSCLQASHTVLSTALSSRSSNNEPQKRHDGRWQAPGLRHKSKAALLKITGPAGMHQTSRKARGPFHR